jgi:hypothetical protein
MCVGKSAAIPFDLVEKMMIEGLTYEIAFLRTRVADYALVTRT